MILRTYHCDCCDQERTTPHLPAGWLTRSEPDPICGSVDVHFCSGSCADRFRPSPSFFAQSGAF